MFNLDWRPPTFHTARLVVRPFGPADAEPLFPHASDPAVTRFTLWDHHRTVDDTRQYVDEYARCRYAEGVPEPLAVCLAGDPRPVGSVGCFWASQPNRTMELGYWVGEAHRGRGLVAEAVRPLVTFVFAAYPVARVQARVVVGNDASRRVLEKVGFRYEGTLRGSLYRRGETEDVLYFAVLKGEWAALEATRPGGPTTGTAGPAHA